MYELESSGPLTTISTQTLTEHFTKIKRKMQRNQGFTLNPIEIDE